MGRRTPTPDRPGGSGNGPVVVDCADAVRWRPSVHDAARRIEAGHELFGVGARVDAVCNLIAGWVALYTWLEDGRRQIVQFVLPGGVFGMFGTLSGRATYGAQALTGALVCCIPLDALNARVRDNPDVAVRLGRSLSRHRALADRTSVV